MTQDTGEFIGTLIQERDDALANLRLRETDIRSREHQIHELLEQLARTEAADYQHNQLATEYFRQWQRSLDINDDLLHAVKTLLMSCTYKEGGDAHRVAEAAIAKAEAKE